MLCRALVGLATVIGLVFPIALPAKERLALIIGNSNYEDVQQLTNPLNDAEDLAAAFQRLDFDVRLRTNLGGQATRRALRDFSREADGAEMAVIYFAGHGLEIDHQNYLLPVDAKIERARDVIYESVPLSQLVEAVSGAENLRLVLLDACRNNPFLLQMEDAESRSIGQGLARIEPPGGILVSYAAKGGTLAYDGEGRNSPYAAALLQYLEAPGLEIGKLFRSVRDSVYTATNGEQEPFTYGSLPAKDIYLAAVVPGKATEQDMLQAFARADIADTVEGWTEFIEKWGYTGLAPKVMDRARRKRAALLAEPTASSATPQANGPSPLIRACDGLAGDPEDPARPQDVAGVVMESMQPQLALQACTLATAGHPGHLRSLYQLGRVYRALGDDKEPLAEQYLRQAADGGYPVARIALAQLYFSSATFSQRRGDAVAMLQQATEEGSAVAPRLLADEIMRNPIWTGLSLQDAPGFYQIAAARGDAAAMYVAGSQLLSKNAPSAEETERGIRYLQTAANGGDNRAAIRLANYYFVEDGDPKTIKRGTALLEKAAEAGDSYAAQKLIRAYLRGDVLDRDLTEAVRWLKVGAEAGDTLMMVWLGYMLEEGKGVAEAQPGTAATYYFRALKSGEALPVRRAGREWHSTTARALQNLLRNESRARYRGPIDGSVGPGTRASMTRLCGCKASGTTVLFSDLFN